MVSSSLVVTELQLAQPQPHLRQYAVAGQDFLQLDQLDMEV